MRGLPLRLPRFSVRGPPRRIGHGMRSARVAWAAAALAGGVSRHSRHGRRDARAASRLRLSPPRRSLHSPGDPIRRQRQFHRQAAARLCERRMHPAPRRRRGVEKRSSRSRVAAARAEGVRLLSAEAGRRGHGGMDRRWRLGSSDEAIFSRAGQGQAPFSRLRREEVGALDGHRRRPDPRPAAGATRPPLPAPRDPAPDRPATRSAADEIDMGTGFDCFDPRSHTASPAVTAEQRRWRQVLVDAMRRRGFTNYSAEWWHFTHGGKRRRGSLRLRHHGAGLRAAGRELDGCRSS